MQGGTSCNNGLLANLQYVLMSGSSYMSRGPISVPTCARYHLLNIFSMCDFLHEQLFEKNEDYCPFSILCLAPFYVH